MKFFYLLILFIVCTVFGYSQTIKGIDSPTALSSNFDIKVVRFYPNPATSVINFEFQKPSYKTYSLQIFNFIGKKVLEINNFSQKNTIPVTDFFRGVYIFQLRDKSGRIVESGKFQVTK